MDTTRRYPRSLAEAFPDVRASSGDWHRMPALDVAGIGHRIVPWAALVCAVVLWWLL